MKIVTQNYMQWQWITVPCLQTCKHHHIQTTVLSVLFTQKINSAMQRDLHMCIHYNLRNLNLIILCFFTVLYWNDKRLWIKALSITVLYEKPESNEIFNFNFPRHKTIFEKNCLAWVWKKKCPKSKRNLNVIPWKQTNTFLQYIII